MPELPMSVVRVRSLLLLLAAGASGAVAAQSPEYPMLQVGKEQTVRASGAAGGELFRFLALAGDRVSISVTADNNAALAIYGPDGKRIDADDGHKTLLAVVGAEKDGVYFASVVLRPVGNYTIKLERYHTAAPAPPPRPSADPAVYGVFARLLGASVQGPKNSGLFYAWSLGTDGTIVQDRADVGERQIIKPAGPGRLHMINSEGKVQEGVIAADGSVTWHWPRASTGVRISLRDGAAHWEQVILEKDGSGGEVITHKLLQGNLPAEQ
jgi:hypothetical protein